MTPDPFEDAGWNGGYISTEHHEEPVGRYEEIGMVLDSMIEQPERFEPSSQIAA
jgi:hypothetical protein